MKPGLARAVPMGILGFGVGALIAIVIRLLQGLDPNPDAPYAYVGPAMVLGAFISSFFFIWGMGAFDPRMSVHGEHAEEEHAAEPETEEPIATLSGFTWQVLFWVTLLVVAVGAFAFLPAGPQVQNVAGDGNVAAIGFTALGPVYDSIAQFASDAAGVRLPALSPQLAAVQVSYLVLFILFVLWTILSLFVMAGAIAFLFTYLAAARRYPEGVGIPWRAIIFVLLLLGLAQFPIVAPTMALPMLLISPIFILPLLAIGIAYRNIPLIALSVLVLPLLLLVLVPTVNAGNVWIVYNLFIVLVIEILALRALRYLIPERAYGAISTAVFGLTVAGAIIFTVGVARPDFWQIVFLVLLEIGVALLLLPLAALRSLIPAGVWNRFAATRWGSLIPDFGGWLNGVLRTGLPRILGQR